MTRQVTAFLVLLIINLIVVICYLIWNLFRKKEKRKGFIIRIIIMLFCPVVGPCFFLVGNSLFRTVFSGNVDLNDVIFSKERVKTYLHADEDRERNMVPLEEAIEITDKENLRTLMMNLVRGDIQESLSKISMALNSEDTETAHYAASVLQDALNDFRFKVQQGIDYINENGDDALDFACALIEYMNNVLVQRVLTDLEQKSYVGIMESICEFVYKNQRMTSKYYEAISIRMLEIEDFKSSQKWCFRAQYQFPNTLATYTCQLKLYFTTNQKDRFFEVLNELKKSSIVIDKETLEMIRVFL